MTTLQDRFRNAVAEAPELSFVYWSPGGAETHRLATLEQRAAGVAAALALRGLGRGDKLVVQLPNCSENLVVLMAALQLGVVLVPVPQIYGVTECEFILTHSRARAMVVPRRFRTVDMLQRAGELMRSTALETVFVVGGAESEDLRFVDWRLLESCEVAAGGGQRQAPAPDDICCILYTSGTTANPKPAMHSHRSLEALMDGLTGHMRGPYSPNYMQCFPSGHMGGVIAMLWGVFSRCDTLFMERWDAPAAAAMIHEHDIGIAFGGPFFLRTLLDSTAGRGLGPLKFFAVGGASVPPVLIEDAEAVGIVAARAYGSTEHPMLTIGLYGDSLEDRVTTDGRCVNGNQFRLVDDDGLAVLPGQPGEVQTRGPSRFVGYDDGALNADAFTSDCWFRTGDIGIADSRGHLRIVDRKKDIIIRGGENISSMEVEAVLCSHPAIQDAAVVAWPDERMGEKVAAFVELLPGRTVDIHGIAAHFEHAGVARQKSPEHLIVVDALPRGATGKVLKPDLRRRVRESVAAWGVAP